MAIDDDVVSDSVEYAITLPIQIIQTVLQTLSAHSPDLEFSCPFAKLVFTLLRVINRPHPFQIYYLASSVIVATFLHEQRDFLTGDLERPTGESFLEREAISSSAYFIWIY